MPGPFAFAWVGTIQEQTTLVVNGNTHGGSGEVVTLVGDIPSRTATACRSRECIGIGSRGALCPFGDKRIPDNTYFIFEQTAFWSGAPGSLNLTNVVTADTATTVSSRLNRSYSVWLSAH